MLSFAERPGDHRSLCFDISTRSLLEDFGHKICCPVSRRLITFQHLSVKQYNEKVRQQFETHRIVKRMEAVDKMTRWCGYPTPGWLWAMIIKLYKQMTEIRVHAKKNCRKILRPKSNYSPTIQMWYDRIHTYLQLIKLNEGNSKNISDILWFARWQHIEQPDKFTMEKLKDGLQLAHIRKTDLWQQTKGLCKVHLQDCMIDMQSKWQHKRVAEIKQKCNRKDSKRMWYLIKRTVKDPHSPIVLKVQQVVEGNAKKYTPQYKAKHTIQHECKIRFSLARVLLLWQLLGNGCVIFLTRHWHGQ